MRHLPTVTTVRFKAYHVTRPLKEVVAVLGHGELERSVDDFDPDDEGLQLTVWVRTVAGSPSVDILAEAASWLVGHRTELERLCEDDWELHMDIEILARGPVFSRQIPSVLMEEVNRLRCVALEISVIPKPNILS